MISTISFVHVKIMRRKEGSHSCAHETPPALRATSPARRRSFSATIHPALQASMLRGICNPTQLSIRICNPKKQFQCAVHTHHAVFEKSLRTLRIRKSAAPVAPDYKSVAAMAATKTAPPRRGQAGDCCVGLDCCVGFVIPRNRVSGFVIRKNNSNVLSTSTTRSLKSPCGLCGFGNPQLLLRRIANPSQHTGSPPLTLRGICNPTQWNIRICNPRKQFLCVACFEACGH